MFKDSLPSDLLTDLVREGYVVMIDDLHELTDKGKDEKTRLCTLAGLNISYSSERKAKEKES